MLGICTKLYRNNRSVDKSILEGKRSRIWQCVVQEQENLVWVFSVQGGESILPFVRQFYGAPSTYLWQDDAGGVHEIHQGEGGEQGDALMPALFCLGQHNALVEAFTTG